MKGTIEYNGKIYEECPMGFHDLEIITHPGISKVTHYFKEKEKFPIVFENEDRVVKVSNYGDLRIGNKNTGETIHFSPYYSLPLLEKAIEKSKELRK